MCLEGRIHLRYPVYISFQLKVHIEFLGITSPGVWSFRVVKWVSSLYRADVGSPHVTTPALTLSNEGSTL